MKRIPSDHPPEVGAEPVAHRDPGRLDHLAQNRRLIVRRSLLASALGGLIPVPVMDDLVAGRVRAGLYMKLAATRHVDLPAVAAEVLAEDKGSSAMRNITLTAATLLALKLAWRKFFALLAAGRGAEEMATIFQIATLFDHYCAKVHVGGPLTRAQAAELRKSIHASVGRTSKTRLAGAFREGGRMLGRSVVEAPAWVSRSLTRYAERWMRTSGHPEAAANWPPEESEEERTWLDRAAHVVEESLASLGQDYLADLVDDFEGEWRKRS